MNMKTATIALATLALAACNEPAADNAPENALAIEQAAPPGAGGLVLDIDGVMENGNPMTFTVTGAQPGENVFLILGFDDVPCALTPPPLGGLCIDVQGARLLGIPQNPLTADAAGTATITLNAPGQAVIPDGFVAWFQAATVGATAATSNTVGKFNPLDDSGVFTYDILDDVQVVPGTSYDGSRFEIYYSAFNGLDLCVIEYEATGVDWLTSTGGPDCAGCDFSFDVTYDNAVDGSSAGDCDFMLGIDVSTIAAFNDGFGYNSNYYIANYGYYPVATFYYDVGGYWTWLTTGVYYQAGAFAWLIDQVNFYYYP